MSVFSCVGIEAEPADTNAREISNSPEFDCKSEFLGVAVPSLCATTIIAGTISNGIPRLLKKTTRANREKHI